MSAATSVVWLVLSVWFLAYVLGQAQYSRQTADAWREVAEYYEGELDKRRRAKAEHDRLHALYFAEERP